MKLKTICAATTLALGLVATAGASNGNMNVIVKLKDSASLSDHTLNKGQAKRFANTLGINPKHTYGSALLGFSASVSPGQLKQLQKNDMVASVEMDREHRLFKGKPGGGGGSTSQTTPWGIARTGADSNNNEGAGVHVYILDTGLDSDHADLAGNIGNGFAAEQCKGRSCTTAWDDDHGHGTHVGGTVGAIDNNIDVVGVASQVTLHAGKICTSRGSCPNSSTIAALDWVTSEITNRGQAAVVNMSIGGSGSVTGSCTNNGFTGNDSYHEALCNARNAGAVIVVAAGNDSDDAEFYTPAGYDDTVITVSSARQGDDWNSFSNWGNNSASWTSNNSAPVAIAAPGGSILSLRVGGGTTTMSGTSMASPHVAGAAALYLASHPQQANGNAFLNTRSALLQSAESTANWSNTSGDPHDEDFLDASGL
ncbi:MAG: S8 family serine peptidase [Kangiellaceae bacterium]|nr:S8 family serine peptidase [Kangiellaceae bacterium]